MFFKFKNIKQAFSLLVFVTSTIFPEGFIAGTLIKTRNGYVPIEQLKENDSVISYGFKNKELCECKILKIKKQNYDKAIKIKANGSEIITALDHKFYLPLSKKRWGIASELKPKDSILRNIQYITQIDEVTKINCTSDFYSLSIDKYHNFFITELDFFVHNEPITLGSIGGWVFTVEILWPAFVGISTCIFKACTGNKYVDHSTILKGSAFGTGGMILYKGLTNKEARKIAGEKGLKEKKGEFDSHGAPVFEDERGRLYTPDQDCHGASVWKELNKKGKRIASLDEDFNPIRD